MKRPKKKKPQQEAEKPKKKRVNLRVKNWNEWGEYLLSSGLQRYAQAVQRLPDDRFIQRFEAMLEYFKPKQSRALLEIEEHKTVYYQVYLPQTEDALKGARPQFIEVNPQQLENYDDQTN